MIIAYIAKERVHFQFFFSGVITLDAGLRCRRCKIMYLDLPVHLHALGLILSHLVSLPHQDSHRERCYQPFRLPNTFLLLLNQL